MNIEIGGLFIALLPEQARGYAAFTGVLHDRFVERCGMSWDEVPAARVEPVLLQSGLGEEEPVCERVAAVAEKEPQPAQLVQAVDRNETHCHTRGTRNTVDRIRKAETMSTAEKRNRA